MEKETEVRNLRAGDWYWIHKAVIQEYMPKIGATGLVVYNFLASLVDRSQCCFPSQKYISEKLDYSRATINRAIRRLAEAGLVLKDKKRRYRCVYRLLRCNTHETQVSNSRNSGVAEIDTNNNTIKRIINNIDNIKSLESDFDFFKGFNPKTKEELLALDLATALNDPNGLPLYLSYSKKYSESLLRKVLREVKAIPIKSIKKSRGALFNYLIQKYAKEASHNIRD